MCPSLIEEVCSESGITTKDIHKVCVFKAFHRETFWYNQQGFWVQQLYIGAQESKKV